MSGPGSPPEAIGFLVTALVALYALGVLVGFGARRLVTRIAPQRARVAVLGIGFAGLAAGVLLLDADVRALFGAWMHNDDGYIVLAVAAGFLTAAAFPRARRTPVEAM